MSQWIARLSVGFNAFFAHNLGRFLRSSSGNGYDSHQLANDVRVLAQKVRAHKERTAVWIDDIVTTRTVTKAILGLSGDGTAYVLIYYPVTI